MDNSSNNNPNDTDEIDWDDDSGEIHTVSYSTRQKPKDGWNEVQRLNGVRADDKPQYIKGAQFHFSYTTDDYRKVIPTMVIGTIFVAAFCIGSWFFSPIAGVFMTVFGVVWIGGTWKDAPIKKWKNQAKRLREEKERKNTHDMDKK